MLWSDFLAEIRTEIGDSGTTPRFSDTVLWTYTRDAINDISRYPSLDLRIDRVTLVVDSINPKKFTLPTDFVEEIMVECPIDTALEPKQFQMGHHYQSVAPLTSYYTDRTNIYLNAAPNTGDSVLLTYLASHPYPANASSVFTFTIQAKDMDLVRLYVLGRVLKWMRVQQSKLDRFKVGSGARTDNPIFPETLDLEKTYQTALFERLPSGGVMLYRPGKGNYGHTRRNP